MAERLRRPRLAPPPPPPGAVLTKAASKTPHPATEAADAAIAKVLQDAEKVRSLDRAISNQRASATVSMATSASATDAQNNRLPAAKDVNANPRPAPRPTRPTAKTPAVASGDGTNNSNSQADKPRLPKKPSVDGDQSEDAKPSVPKKPTVTLKPAATGSPQKPSSVKYRKGGDGRQVVEINIEKEDSDSPKSSSNENVSNITAPPPVKPKPRPRPPAKPEVKPEVKPGVKHSDNVKTGLDQFEAATKTDVNLNIEAKTDKQENNVAKISTSSVTGEINRNVDEDKSKTDKNIDTKGNTDKNVDAKSNTDKKVNTKSNTDQSPKSTDEDGSDKESKKGSSRKKSGGGIGLFASFRARLSLGTKEDSVGEESGKLEKKKKTPSLSSIDKASRLSSESKSTFYVAEDVDTPVDEEKSAAKTNDGKSQCAGSTFFVDVEGKKDENTNSPVLPPKHRAYTADSQPGKELVSAKGEAPKKPAPRRRKKKKRGGVLGAGGSDASSCESVLDSDQSDAGKDTLEKEAVITDHVITDHAATERVVTRGGSGPRSLRRQQDAFKSFTTEDLDVFQTRKSVDEDYMEEEDSVSTPVTSPEREVGARWRTLTRERSHDPLEALKRDRRRSKSVGAPEFLNVRLKPVARKPDGAPPPPPALNPHRPPPPPPAAKPPLSPAAAKPHRSPQRSPLHSPPVSPPVTPRGSPRVSPMPSPRLRPKKETKSPVPVAPKRKSKLFKDNALDLSVPPQDANVDSEGQKDSTAENVNTQQDTDATNATNQTDTVFTFNVTTSESESAEKVEDTGLDDVIPVQDRDSTAPVVRPQVGGRIECGQSFLYDNSLNVQIPVEDAEDENVYTEVPIESPLTPTNHDDFYEEIEFPENEDDDEGVKETESEMRVQTEQAMGSKDGGGGHLKPPQISLLQSEESSNKVRRKVSTKLSRKLTRKLTQRIKDRHVDETVVKALLRAESLDPDDDDPAAEPAAGDVAPDNLDFSETDSEWDSDSDSDAEWEEELVRRLQIRLTDRQEEVLQCDVEIKDATLTRDSQQEVESAETRVRKIATELLTTERAYVERLHLVDQVFHFRVVLENRTHRMFPDDVVPQMFSNVKSIYQFHHDFLLPQLEKRMTQWDETPRIGDVMQKFAPFLKLYSEYVKNFDLAMKVIESWQVKSPRFYSIMEEIQKTPECRGLSLQHHMLEPIQRVPRYELLLKEYLKRLPLDSPDRPDAQNALELVSDAAKHSNEAFKKIEKFRKLLEINEALGGVIDLTSPTRELVKEGPVVKVSPRNGAQQPRYAFLFNDLLLVCESLLLGSTYRVRNKLEIAGMQVLEGDNLELQHTFYVKGKVKTIELHLSTFEEKLEWQVALWNVISDFTKKQMSRKAAAAVTHAFQDAGLGRAAPKWIRDSEVTMCMMCGATFTHFRRRHHCRACGIVVCGKCSTHKARLAYDGDKPNRVCDKCHVALLESAGDAATPGAGDISAPVLAPGSPAGGARRRGILQVKATDPSAVISGYLHMTLDRREWTRRFFAVHNDFVLYSFGANHDVSALTSMPLPGYVATAATASDGLESRGDYVFKLSHPGQQKTYYFQVAENDRSVFKRWLYVMECVVNAELPTPAGGRAAAASSVVSTTSAPAVPPPR